jgi:tetratricopeptide (TPR) repeat protein
MIWVRLLLLARQHPALRRPTCRALLRAPLVHLSLYPETRFRKQLAKDAETLYRNLDLLAAAPLPVGIFLVEAEQYARAFDVLKPPFDRHPDDASPLHLKYLGISAFMIDEFHLAVDCCERYHAHGRLDPRLLFQLGEAYRMNGNLDIARQTFEKVLTRQPGNPIALERMAVLEWQARNFDVSRHYAEDARRLAPDAPQPLIVLTANLIELDVFDEAIKILEDARTRFPDVPDFGPLLAHAHIQRGAEAEGISLLQQLTDATWNDPDGLYKVAEIYELHGDLPTALRLLTQCLHRDPDHAEARTMIERLTKD